MGAYYDELCPGESCCASLLIGETDVRAGLDGGPRLGPRGFRASVRRGDWLVHPSYAPPGYENDVALIFFSAELLLPREYAIVATSDPPLLAQMAVLGWGKTSAKSQTSEFLMNATLRQVPSPVCTKQYQSGSYNVTRAVPEDAICAGLLTNMSYSVDSCTGDSGGPLVEYSQPGGGRAAPHNPPAIPGFLITTSG